MRTGSYPPDSNKYEKINIHCPFHYNSPSYKDKLNDLFVRLGYGPRGPQSRKDKIKWYDIFTGMTQNTISFRWIITVLEPV